MTAAPAARTQVVPGLVVAVAFATLVRSAVGGAAPASSAPAAVAFSVTLAAAAVWAGACRAPIPWRGVVVGTAGAVALVGLSLAGVPAVHFAPRAAAPTLLWWVPLVTVVAAVEELILRGVLFDAVRGHAGDAIAVAATAILFAVIHLPLYGTPALGIDLCAGVFLGCLRVASGSVAAPLVAHVLADVATGWLG